MKKKIVRIFTIIVIGMVSFLLLLGIVHFYQNYVYEHPLEKELLKISGLEFITLEENDNLFSLEIEFNSPENYRQNFYCLLEYLQGEKKIRLENFLLKINNNSADQELVTFLKKAKLPLYEAIKTGHFTVLPEQLANFVPEDKFHYYLEVDQQYIFLSAQKDEKFANLIISNEAAPLQVITLEKGGYL